MELPCKPNSLQISNAKGICSKRERYHLPTYSRVRYWPPDWFIPQVFSIPHMYWPKSASCCLFQSLGYSCGLRGSCKIEKFCLVVICTIVCFNRSMWKSNFLSCGQLGNLEIVWNFLLNFLNNSIFHILSVVWCIPVMQNEIVSCVVKESQCLSNLNLIGHCVSYSGHVKQTGTSCVQFSTIFPG